jgi:4'-phosphopantetheinyl transferase
VDIDSIAPTVFHEHELATLRAVRSEVSRRRHFFALWTLKEAYIKARRMGLSVPLDQFWFEPHGELIGPFIEPVLHDPLAGRWVSSVHELPDDHVLALVADRRSGSEPNVRFQWVRAATADETMPIVPGERVWLSSPSP